MDMVKSFAPWIVFVVVALAAVAGSAADLPGLQTAVTVIGLIWAIKFTKSYPDRAVAAAGVRHARPA